MVRASSASYIYSRPFSQFTFIAEEENSIGFLLSGNELKGTVKNFKIAGAHCLNQGLFDGTLLASSKLNRQSLYRVCSSSNDLFLLIL
jgi:hypothetical protein